MSEKLVIHKPVYSFLPTDIEGLDALAELALDLRWSWNHAEDEVWRQLDPDLWEITHNPWMVLQTVSRDQFQKVMSDPDFRKKVDTLLKNKEQTTSGPAWFHQNYPDSSLTCIAYFSMEFMLSEALPIYSGGLGNVAGDQLKAASDLGVPVVGIGLLYQQGYFRQEIDRNGEQQALFPFNDPGQLPITPLRKPDGEWLRLEINLPGYSLWLRAWQVQIGSIKLYLLDSNDAANFPVHRCITSELYGGGTELRLKQEIVLGIGGWRLLQALGIQPEVCHLNEGHAAFAILERAYSFMTETGQSFDVALAATRAGNLFTTHTAVAAGFDYFPSSLILQYLGEYAVQKLGITTQQLLALGRNAASNESENFNMAYLAIHGSGAVNGVSRLHGEVSRHIFEPLFPNWPTNEVPVGHITNGVHMPTWDSKDADEIWTEFCGKDRWLGTNKTLEQDIRRVSDERLWEMRLNANKTLIGFAGEHLSRQLLGSGHSSEVVEHAKNLFDPNVLTLGFARRFAPYKRPNLLLHDPQRLLRLLTNAEFPVQLIISGKAHPADKEGQNLIKEWIHFIKQNNFQPRVIFLSDYDMHISEHLVQGVDVWINTPRRPWEASGTSGMKVLVNGGINLSELDGWWAEAYTPEIGWAIGDGNEHVDDTVWDALEAEQLYTILEQNVVPEFYNRNQKGIPTVWIKRMRESMAQLTPRFSADRSVREYTEQHYLPAAKAYLDRAANKGEKGKRISDSIHSMEENWNTLHFGIVKIETIEDHHKFEIPVYFQDLNPDNVQIELYSDELNDEAQIVQIVTRGDNLEGESNAFTYHASVSTHRAVSDFTVRAIPVIPDVSVPLEISNITWQH
ncbi:alpha-glucan family phosphorylase [Flavobacterium sp. UBA6031]|uniref:alpha-glucan family phosphorylase n=1 Tax=Flavobacterium sp. UBA6031 TaxID=1946551 RepID=UPI0025BDB220|nr:alpha-glucan family phosphorylase [Flavobacterium sp. UBA6031]